MGARRPNNSALNFIGKTSTRKTQPNYQSCRRSLNKNGFTGEFYQKFREELTLTLQKTGEEGKLPNSFYNEKLPNSFYTANPDTKTRQR